MGVKIRIKGNEDMNEYEDAQDLKRIFEKEIPQTVNGEILIISNATLFGQDVKDIDLVVIGYLNNYNLQLNVPAKEIVGGRLRELPTKIRKVKINSFCFVIETKRHDASNIQLDGIVMKVKYNGKYHDATNQSEKQKKSLMNFLGSSLEKTPYICNFIWFRSMSEEDINNLVSFTHNYLPNMFSLEYLFGSACNQQIPIVNNISCNFTSMRNLDVNKIEQVFKLFEEKVNAVSELTRTKIENITMKLLSEQNYAKAIGKKLVIVSGRAGTGKTMKLLRIARDLAFNKSCRCLILTFNHALVSDIKRMLALARIPDGLDTFSVNIQTVHQFIYELILGFEIEDNPQKLFKDYLDRYDNYLEELYQYIEIGLISTTDIQDLMKKYHDRIAWDYVLIDESQDWKSKEKEVLYQIFGYNKIIIADGIDQLVRSKIRCDWAKELKSEHIAKTYEKKCIRQKNNLVNFVNKYAEKSNIEWNLEAKKEILGGKVIVIIGDYNYEIHKNEYKRCKDNGNSAYEMLFLVPPTLVERQEKVNKYNKIEVERQFSLKETFRKNGIDIWDGTNKDLRTKYPIDLNEHRLLQYDSCRGLEGWTVVCLELDEFIKYKSEEYEKSTEKEINDNLLETKEERKNKFVHLWSLIPLTRAIDTLIITVKNRDSELAKKLYEIYKDNEDYIEWIKN